MDDLRSMPPDWKATSLFEIDGAAIQRFARMKDWMLECWEIARGDRPMTWLAYDAFWKTMLCDMDSSDQRASVLYSEYFLSYFRFMRQAPDVLTTKLQGLSPIAPREPTPKGKATNLAVLLGLLPNGIAPDASHFHDWFDSHLRTNILVEESM